MNFPLVQGAIQILTGTDAWAQLSQKYPLHVDMSRVP